MIWIVGSRIVLFLFLGTSLVSIDSYFELHAANDPSAKYVLLRSICKQGTGSAALAAKC